jgi:hypothetical protein
MTLKQSALYVYTSSVKLVLKNVVIKLKTAKFRDQISALSIHVRYHNHTLTHCLQSDQFSNYFFQCSSSSFAKNNIPKTKTGMLCLTK